MLKKAGLTFIGIVSANLTFADVSSINNGIFATHQQGQVESQQLNNYNTNYSGNIGTGIKHDLVSAAGGAIEFTPAGQNYYAFFTQTLANGIYYEARLYIRDNYDSQNPIFSTIPPSNEHNPGGYGAVIKGGYDFHLNELIDIIPYLRLNAYNNMSIVYGDTNGDYIHSTTYSIFPGLKIAYKVTPQFNPYIDFFGGWQQVNLTGGFPQNNINGPVKGQVTQQSLTYEIGFSSKLTKNLALIPYMQYVTTVNHPNGTAADKNQFNVSPLTGTQQVYGLKLSLSW